MAVEPHRTERPAPRPELRVSCVETEPFLFAYVANLGALGVFVPTSSPLPIGSAVSLRFEDPGASVGELALSGDVAWVNPVRNGDDNPNPGMGVLLRDVGPDQRERLVTIVRAIAYLDDPNDGS